MNTSLLQRFYFRLLLLVFVTLSTPFADAVVLKVAPDKAFKEGEGVHTLRQALEKVEAGDTVKLAPGVYQLNLGMQLAGTPEQPIKIMGSGEATKIELTSSGGKYCVGFQKSHFIELHDLSFSNCGDIPIVLKDSTYFTFKNISFVGGRFPIYADGEKTHHILLDSISWNQDPSGRMYGEIPWSESHHGEYVHFNGSLIYGKGIAGSVIVRNSTIKNAFNGIRLKGKKDRIGLTNLNVEIYNNVFQNIRDNPVEPEVDATNWWVHHNRIQDAHAYFSFTKVAGGDWYIFRNIGVSERVITGEHTGGKILKFEDHGFLPTGPFIVFNNSWFGPRPIATGGQSRNLQYLNNAHQFAGSITPLKSENYHPSYRIRNNLVNAAIDLEVLKESNIYLADFQFLNKENLHAGQQVIDAGVPIVVKGYTVKFSGKAPDIGAYENDGVSDYPPFKFDNRVYEEYPRLVKIDRHQPSKLVLWSSVALTSDTDLKAEAVYQDGRRVKVALDVDGPRVIISSLDSAMLKELRLPRLTGINGLKMLEWGAVDGDFRIINKL